MKNHLYIAFLTLVIACLPAAAQADTKTDVLSANTQFIEARRKGDVTALSQLLAPNFVATDHEGTTMDRKAFLAFVKSNKLRVHALKPVKAYTVTVHGNTAAVTGVQTLQWALRNGPQRTTKAQVTRIFLNHEGKWLLFALHWHFL